MPIANDINQSFRRIILFNSFSRFPSKHIQIILRSKWLDINGDIQDLCSDQLWETIALSSKNASLNFRCTCHLLQIIDEEL